MGYITYGSIRGLEPEPSEAPVVSMHNSKKSFEFNGIHVVLPKQPQTTIILVIVRASRVVAIIASTANTA